MLRRDQIVKTLFRVEKRERITVQVAVDKQPYAASFTLIDPATDLDIGTPYRTQAFGFQVPDSGTVRLRASLDGEGTYTITFSGERGGRVVETVTVPKGAGPVVVIYTITDDPGPS
jgi:hypothetical protein